MNTDNFEKLMSEHTDERLLDVLKHRKEYQETAVEAAIKEAIHRNIISNLKDLENKYPIYDKGLENSTKELRFLGQQIDFKKSSKELYMIGIGCGLAIGIIFYTIPIVQIIYLGMVYYCSKYYNHTMANVIIWMAAFQIGAVILYFLSLFLKLLI